MHTAKQLRAIAIALALFLPVLESRATTHIVVMPDAQDPASLSQESRSFRLALSAANDLLAEFDYRVLSTDVLRLRNPGLVDSESSVALARSVTDPPIDVVVLLEILPVEVSSHVYRRQLRVWMTGRLLDVRSGHLLGTFRTESTLVSTGAGCEDRCLDNRIARKAETLGRDMAHVLQLKLEGWEANRPLEYEVRFENVGSARRDEVFSLLKGLEGATDLRCAPCGGLNDRLWYYSQRDSSRVFSALNPTCRQLKLTCVVADGEIRISERSDSGR